MDIHRHTSSYINIRGHTSSYINIHRHTSSYIDTRRHTHIYMSSGRTAAQCPPGGAVPPSPAQRSAERFAVTAVPGRFGAAAVPGRFGFAPVAPLTDPRRRYCCAAPRGSVRGRMMAAMRDGAAVPVSVSVSVPWAGPGASSSALCSARRCAVPTRPLWCSRSQGSPAGRGTGRCDTEPGPGPGCGTGIRNRDVALGPEQGPEQQRDAAPG